MTAWVALLALLLFGYFVLEGFDFGLGMLLPLLGRDHAERQLVISAMGPFFLGNEVWLVGIAGFIAGVFPFLDGPLLAGLYPLIVILLVSWIVRDAGVWFRSRWPSALWRAFWDGTIVAGSVGLALNWGVIIGNLVQGLPVSADGTVRPDPVGLFNLPALLCGCALAALFTVHGATFVALRLEGHLRARARRLQREALPLALVLVVAASVGLVPGIHPFVNRSLLLGVALAVPLLLSIGSWVALRRPGLAFGCTAAAAGLPVLALGAPFPVILVSNVGVRGLTVARVLAGTATLDVLRWFVLIVILVVLCYQAASWWAFGRRQASGRMPVFF